MLKTNTNETDNPSWRKRPLVPIKLCRAKVCRLNKHKHAAHKAKLHACASKGKVDILNRSWQEHIHTIDDLNREVNRWQNWNGIPW